MKRKSIFPVLPRREEILARLFREHEKQKEKETRHLRISAPRSGRAFERILKYFQEEY